MVVRVTAIYTRVFSVWFVCGQNQATFYRPGGNNLEMLNEKLKAMFASSCKCLNHDSLKTSIPGQIYLVQKDKKMSLKMCLL